MTHKTDETDRCDSGDKSDDGDMEHPSEEGERSMAAMQGPPVVVTFAQWKGGVGKSTLATHVASLMDGILVDLEPWGAATTWWAGRHAAELWQGPDGSAVLRALRNGKAPRVRRGEAKRSRLVPSHEQLLTLGKGRSNGTSAWAWTTEGEPALMVPTEAGPRRLEHALAERLPEWAREWGCPVIVDTPAGFSPLADGAIAGADVVVVPVTPDQWGVPAMEKFIASYPGVRVGLIVPNRVRANRKSDDTWSEYLQREGVVTEPFIVGPEVSESEVLHVAVRPIDSGPPPGSAREAVIRQLDELVAAILHLATGGAHV
jgi:cellulose biosynthesis protein BcsQ